MQTAKEREEAFRRDLAALLDKHEAEIDVTDDGRPYGMHSGVCRVTMQGLWDENGDPIAEHTEFEL